MYRKLIESRIEPFFAEQSQSIFCHRKPMNKTYVCTPYPYPYVLSVPQLPQVISLFQWSVKDAYCTDWVIAVYGCIAGVQMFILDTNQLGKVLSHIFNARVSCGVLLYLSWWSVRSTRSSEAYYFTALLLCLSVPHFVNMLTHFGCLSPQVSILAC